MKKLLFMTTAIAGLCAACSEENPLLVEEFTALHGAIPFDKIQLHHYAPAFAEGMRRGREEISAIAQNTQAPTFENTIVALEMSGMLLSRTSQIFFNLNEANTTPQMQALAQELQPQLTAYDNDITLNEKLFERIKAVYISCDTTNMSNEQKMLLLKTYRRFVRNGANLNAEDKERYREYSLQLAKASLKFKENALAATNNYSLNITDSADLTGLPPAVVEQAAKDAQSRQQQGWTFTLQAPSYTPFMKFAQNRMLREKLYTAYHSRAALGDENDNRAIISEIVNTRLKIANLLGYNTYADYVLEERMAENSTNVHKLLSDLLTAATPSAKREVEEVKAFIRDHAPKDGSILTTGNETDPHHTLQNYDWTYYGEKLREHKFSINEEVLRPYFEVNRVVQGIFMLANKLYGITFKENAAIPVWHQDVKVYEVYDKDGSFLALYYTDLYPRQGKRSGAWKNNLRQQYGSQRPFVINVCNFTRPTQSMPALLSFTEVTTLLHEFGHALHGIFAQGSYPSLTGTAVYRDFVEMPSQIMENYATKKEFLDLFAVHYQSGERIPAEYIEKIAQSQNYMAGYLTLRQLAFGMLDMAYHDRNVPFEEKDFASFEWKTIASTQMMPQLPSCLVSPAFNHIFGGGYAAGYYGYKWAEVIEADAFSLFLQNGIFDSATAQSLRDNILSKGGSEHPMVLYKRFRGKAPSVDALLNREGFTK
jgi:peptidyl-dipeptidase Dcp